MLLGLLQENRLRHLHIIEVLLARQFGALCGWEVCVNLEFSRHRLPMRMEDAPRLYMTRSGYYKYHPNRKRCMRILLF